VFFKEGKRERAGRRENKQSYLLCFLKERGREEEEGGGGGGGGREKRDTTLASPLK
jgi:hypothetical protein